MKAIILSLILFLPSLSYAELIKVEDPDGTVRYEIKGTPTAKEEIKGIEGRIQKAQEEKTQREMKDKIISLQKKIDSACGYSANKNKTKKELNITLKDCTSLMEIVDKENIPTDQKLMLMEEIKRGLIDMNRIFWNAPTQ